MEEQRGFSYFSGTDGYTTLSMHSSTSDSKISSSSSSSNGGAHVYGCFGVTSLSPQTTNDKGQRNDLVFENDFLILRNFDTHLGSEIRSQSHCFQLKSLSRVSMLEEESGQIVLFFKDNTHIIIVCAVENVQRVFKQITSTWNFHCKDKSTYRL